MAFRRLKAKKYKGISEYFNPSHNDAVTLSYYVDYRNEFGKVVKKKLSNATTKDDALNQLNQIKYEVSKKKELEVNEDNDLLHSIRNNRLTLDAMAKLYFSDRTTKNNTKDKQRYEKHVSPVLGYKSVAKLKTKDFISLQATLKEKIGNKTVNDTLNIVRAMYNEGMSSNNKWCDNNPLVSKDIKKLKEITQPGRVLSDDELSLLFNTVLNGDYDLSLRESPSLYLFLKCLYFTGARPAAILSLKFQDINFNENKINLMPMKLSDGYTAAVNIELLEFLKSWIEKYDIKYNEYLFYPQLTYLRNKDEKIKKTSTTYDVFLKKVSPYFKKLFNENIPSTDKMNRVTFYSLRRTSGTKVYKAKGIYHAMVFLNHTSIKTTQKYLNVKSDMGDITNVL